MPRYKGYVQGSGNAALRLGDDELRLIADTPHTVLDCTISVDDDGQDYLVVIMRDGTSRHWHDVYRGRLCSLRSIEPDDG
jgi:hypothetical protein